MVDGDRPLEAPLDAERAWRLLLALRRAAGAGRLPRSPTGLRLDPAGGLALLPLGHPQAAIELTRGGGWRATAEVAAEAALLLELYLPICAPGGDEAAQWPLVVGHLGQSLDGRIATEAGASQYVTGPQNIVHLHRMRALSDAVVVGADTIRQDNPRLTTRHVAGDSPARVVVDPRRRLADHYGIFGDDAAPTLVVCAADLAVRKGRWDGRAEVVGIPAVDGTLSPAAIVSALRRRGLRRLFVEGGGQTVSRFLIAGQLDRLQITVAPVLIGSGRSGISLPAVADLSQALRPVTRRFMMGEDVLFDCDLRAGRARSPSGPGEQVEVADREL